MGYPRLPATPLLKMGMAVERTRTSAGRPASTSSWCVYQVRHDRRDERGLCTNAPLLDGANGPLAIIRAAACVFGICLEKRMAGQRHVRLFRNGRNQAVRIPVEFELPSNEAIVYRDGDRLVIQPVRKRGPLLRLPSCAF